MKTIIKRIMLAMCAVMLSTAAFAAGVHGTSDEAVALVKKAVANVKANGKEKAFAEIDDLKGPYVDRDLYIMVYDVTGKNVAHGANPKLIGKNLLDMKDVDGKFVIREFVEVAKAKGKGWIDYKWPNPVTKTVDTKSTYIERVDDIIIGCGIYKQ